MKKIILLRHAKSSWKHPGLIDHDRPLNKRGRNAAPLIGTWLKQNAHLPNVILSSTSERTRETVERVGIASNLTTRFLPELYHASPAQILAALHTANDDQIAAMIVAHEPGISAFAEKLSREVASHCTEAFEHFPTAAVAIFHTNAKRWSDLAYGSADFTDFVKPRDLEAS